MIFMSPFPDVCFHWRLLISLLALTQGKKAAFNAFDVHRTICICLCVQWMKIHWCKPPFFFFFLFYWFFVSSHCMQMTRCLSFRRRIDTCTRTCRRPLSPPVSMTHKCFVQTAFLSTIKSYQEHKIQWNVENAFEWNAGNLFVIRGRQSTTQTMVSNEARIRC